MIKTIFGIGFLSLAALNLQAQDSLDTNPVRQEFNELIEGSNNYQGYKVVDYDALVRLRDNTISHVEELRQEIQLQKDTEDGQIEEIESLENQLAETRAELDRVNSEKDNIRFLGMPLSKGSYMALMWGIVFALLIALILFIYRYKNSNATTKEANKRLQETEKEFDDYRVKALEKEQRLGRLLQDERNKSSN